ncbi:MAG: helix-turn-helix domain-containing protein [Bacteroidales bacterium]
MKNSTIHIITAEDIRRQISEIGRIECLPPFCIVIKSGSIQVDDNHEYIIPQQSISIFAKQDPVSFIKISKDCECILLQYDRVQLSFMTFLVNLVDAFRYIYSNNRLVFKLPKDDFADLWYLSNYIRQITHSNQSSNLSKHIFRHLNYAFLYGCIEKLDRNNKFGSNPINNQEKIVLTFLQNLRDKGFIKLKVSDYAKMQFITTRHLTSTIKRITGRTALELIHQALMDRAKNQLSNSDQPISSIALNLGFTDPYTFSHFFKKQSGMSPTEYRNDYKG